MDKHLHSADECCYSPDASLSWENPWEKVRLSCSKVTENAYHVKINKEKLEELAKHILETEFKYLTWEECHFKITEDITTEQIVAYVIVIDALNFWFWPTPDFEYDHLSSNLNKLLKNLPEFFTAEYLSTISTDIVKSKIFTEDFWLLEERSRLLREVGTCIKTKFNSSFLEFFESAWGSAPKLVDLIIREFPGFRDESVNNITTGDPLKGGQQVFFSIKELKY